MASSISPEDGFKNRSQVASLRELCGLFHLLGDIGERGERLNQFPKAQDYMGSGRLEEQAWAWSPSAVHSARVAYQIIGVFRG